MQISVHVKLTAAALLMITQTGFTTQASQPKAASITISAQTRAELLAARDAAWRAFSDNPGQLEHLLGPELIAIQQSQEDWDNRDKLIKLGEAMHRQGVKTTRLEFPRTEVQVFGNVAILYYTYIFGQAAGNRSVTEAGRGTEVFLRRDGRWVDVGWHLDNGAFVHRNDAWQRMSPSPGGAS